MQKWPLIVRIAVSALLFAGSPAQAQDAPILPRLMNSDEPQYRLDDAYGDYRRCIASGMMFLADAQPEDLLQRIGPQIDDWSKLSAKIIADCKDERADITNKLDVSVRKWRKGKFIAKDPVHFAAMNTLSTELDQMDQEFTANLTHLYEKLSKSNHAQN